MSGSLFLLTSQLVGVVAVPAGGLATALLPHRAGRADSRGGGIASVPAGLPDSGFGFPAAGRPSPGHRSR
ncbi:hypothetical protein [Streptomyces sp. NPDC057617]|uniref:hypothetical protein n=1 Tax=Streptomyces sp. NPDC057617 TaxID=3346184 RepID=UPI0036835618